MNLQEREQLSSFLMQLVTARVAAKDAEAEALIRQAIERQPDAAYLLVQKSFLLEQAVRASQQRIEQLQDEVDALRAAQPRAAFADASAWGNSSGRLQPMAPPLVAAPVAQPAAASWGSGLLGSVAAGAAGAVAGSFLFQGIEHLMGHHNGSGVFGADALSSRATEPKVVNNFFEPDSTTQDNSGFAGLSEGLDSSDDTSWI